MEVVNLILQPVVESLLVPVKKHVDFMTSCKKYVKDMETGMKELNDMRRDVEDHMNENKSNKLKIPAHVPGWLEEVVKVDAEVNNIISSNVGSCFSFTTRHDVGKKAFNRIQDIKRLTEEHSRIEWTNHPIPLGKVDSMTASTSSLLVDYQSDFESREQTFMKALKALEADHKSHMIALCGMGGVGKTTMMESLKTVVKEKRMFSLIVEAVIGEKADLFAIQGAVADYLAIKDFKDISSTPARALKLREWFKNYFEESKNDSDEGKKNSDGGKKKILVIFDDIWQPVDLKGIGLSPFPDQGVDFKVLLTSRSRDVCTTMGVKANSVFNVKILAEAEAQRFFWQFINDSDEADLDPDLQKVGDEIVSRCQGLPIAIKTIAYTLKGKSKDVWDDTLTRLQHHDIHKIVNEVFELSYKNLEDEQTKSVLLLCGLYSEDFDIPTEELVRYGWGLRLFNKVYTIRHARNRLNACIEQLLNTNLLIKSNRAGCIKMHDLVRAFVLKKYSEVEHASIVNIGNMSEWPANDTPDSCKRISLACNRMKEFPRDFKYPNLSFLKLTHGYTQVRFPENSYWLMEKLQVIVYENFKYPLLPKSLEYSTNLRTLCLHECSLMFNCDFIGSLSNLEVLSFANCGIQKLPSTIRNLKKLKLLDLTHCVNLHIDDGTLKNLVKLEELYMRVANEKAISFTNENVNELAERSKNLSAIEIELFKNNVHPKRMSFNNLERFKISVGCFLEKEDENAFFGRSKIKDESFENTLMLVSNKGKLLESRINVLFKKTAVLHLKVGGMNDLEDLKCSSFNNLRVLKVSNCAQLRYLFTRCVAATLLKLEVLEVSSCDIMQTVIHDEGIGSEPIKFPILKWLYFYRLPQLSSLSNTSSCLKKPEEAEVAWWSLCQYSRHIKIDQCYGLSVAIPSYALPHMQYLQELEIQWCNSMKDVFEIRSCSGGEGSCGGENNSSNVVSFTTTPPPQNLPNVVIMILPPDLRNLRRLVIIGCPLLRDVFPFSTLKSLTKLEYLCIADCKDIRVIVKKEEEDGNHTTTTTSTSSHDHDDVVVFPCLKSVILKDLPKLESFFLGTNDFRWPVLDTVQIWNCPKMTTFTQSRLDSPMLKYLTSDMGQNSVVECGINNLFRPPTTTAAASLQQQEVVPSLDVASTSLLLPLPETIIMPSWLYNNLINVHVSYRHNRRFIIGHNELQHMLKIEKLQISGCRGVKEIFETYEMNNGGLSNQTHSVLEVREMVFQNLEDIKCLWKSKQWRVLKFPNLTTLSIGFCKHLRHVFSISMVGSLLQLQELHITRCPKMEMILADVEEKDEDEGRVNEDDKKEDNDDEIRRVTEVVFPCLRSLTLFDLESLKGVCLGMETIHWPSLVTLEIRRCPEIKTFTNGESTTPKLQFIKTDFGLCEITEDVNSFIRTKIEEGYKFERGGRNRNRMQYPMSFAPVSGCLQLQGNN